VLIYVHLSGEHRTLPASEAVAIAEAEGIPFKILAHLDQVLIAESNSLYFRFLDLRAAFIKSAGLVLGITESSSGIEGIKNILRNINLEEYGVSSISFKRIKHYGSEIGFDAFIGLIKKHLPSLRITRKKVKSNNTLELILSNGLVIIGIRKYTRDLRRFRSRDPQKRPVYKPGTLTPEISRLFVNLSRASVSNSDLFLDPFCGVGGFLLEACIIGLETCGCDVNPLYAEGAIRNLEYYGCTANIVVADACKMPFSRADAIGTDPPYGRLTKASGYSSLRSLMLKFLEEAHGVLKKGRYLVFAQKHGVIKENDIENFGFNVIEVHKNWVHGSLTRDVFVVKKV